MFSVREKRDIADKVQKILREMNHPELPKDEIKFHLHVKGAEGWSWADIKNNGSVLIPGVNLHNERQDQKKEIDTNNLWFCGQHKQNSWEFVGIFLTEQKGVDACKDETYFIVSVQLDSIAPDETTIFPNIFYPKLK